MERIRVPAGTAQKFELVFKKLQDAIAKNLLNRVDLFVKSYGAIVNVNNNVPQNANFLVTVQDANSRLIQVNIASATGAKGLAKGNNYIKLDSAVSLTLPAGTGSVDGDAIYIAIMAEHRDAYAENVPVIDGFVYDESGNVAQAATAINDTTVIIQSTYLSLGEVTSAVSTLWNTRIPLAIVKVERISGAYEIKLTWTDHLDRAITDGISDVRHLNRLLLNENLIDDSKLLFKDRDSTRAYNRAVNGDVTFQKRVHFDQSVSLTMGSRLALGGINGLVDETTTNDTFTSVFGGYPILSIHGTNTQDTSVHLKTVSTLSGKGPQLRFINTTNSMAITHDPAGGWLKLGPMDATNPDQLKTDAGVIISNDGDTSIQTNVHLGLLSHTSETDYDVKAYANIFLNKTLQVGRQVIIGRHADTWLTKGFDTTNPGYDTLEVANDNENSSNKASILISQSTKGPNNYSELNWQVTDTSSNKFKNYMRMESTDTATTVFDIGSTNASTGIDTNYLRFDTTGNLTLSKNLFVAGTAGFNNDATFWNVATFTENLITNDQVGIGYTTGTDLSSSKHVLSVSNTHNPGEATSVNITNATADSDIYLALGGPSSGGNNRRFGFKAVMGPSSGDHSFIIGRLHDTNSQMANKFVEFGVNGDATFDNAVNIQGNNTYAGTRLLSVDLIRNTHGASFDAQAIFSKRVGIGYAYGTDTTSWPEVLKVTNPDAHSVVFRLEQSTNELDSALILHAKDSGGVDREWGIVHEGNNQDLLIGYSNSTNTVPDNAIFIKLDRSTARIGLEQNLDINKDVAINGGYIKAKTVGTLDPFFEVNPVGKKIAIGHNAPLTTAFTTNSGQKGDYDLVIASKDTSFKNANLAFVTDHASVEKEFEIELNHDLNHLNFWSHTEAQKVIHRDHTGRVRSTFDQDTGNLTVKTLTLEGSLDMNAGAWNDPALLIPAGQPVVYAGTHQSSMLHDMSASGGYFSIFSNVEPYSFSSGGDNSGQKQDTSNGWAGITLNTATTNTGGGVLLYTGKNEGTDTIDNRVDDVNVWFNSTSAGAKKATFFGEVEVAGGILEGNVVNRLTHGSAQSTIEDLTGNALAYTEASITNKLTADHVVTQTFEAGGIFAASGVGVVSITDRADINAQSTDSILTFHHGDGGGQAMVLSNSANTLSFKKAEFNNVSMEYTDSPDLLKINYSSDEPSVEVGGRLVANSGVFNGDIDVSTGIITSAVTNTLEASVSGRTTTGSLTVISDADVDTMNVVSSLNVQNAVIDLNPATKFSTTISGVARDAYLVASSGTSYYIGQGELGLATDNYPGVELMIAPPEPTIPANFRLTDINPHTDMFQMKSRAILEWGFNKIVGAAGANTTVGGTTYPTFQSTSNTGGDSPDLTDSGGNQRVSGRFLLFPSGKRHMIVGWNNSNKIFTMAVSYDGESSTIANPAKLIDSGTGYTLNVLKQIEGGVGYQPYVAFNLDSTYVDTPRYEMELELSSNYYFGITTTDGTKASENTLMSSGVFDPDGTAAGQGLTEYGAPFNNKLPYLTNLPDLSDHLSIDATQTGFNVTINGWGSTDNQATLNTDVNQIAHQFEIGYTTLQAFDWNASTTTRTTVPFTSANNVPIANIFDSAQYTVAVRPIQNQQVVYDEAVNGTVKKTILAGGGGLPPMMDVVVDYPFSLTAYSGVYTGQVNSGTYQQATISGVSFYADSITGPVTVGFNEFAPQNNFTLITSTQLSNTGQTIINNNQYNGLDNSQAGIDFVIDGLVANEFQGTSIEFEIGATELSRKILETQLNADWILKKIVVDVDWASNVSTGNPGIIRVYPKGNPGAGDSIQITAAAGLFTQAINLQINTSIEENRTIIIDGFDASASPNNNWSIAGTIWVYGQTYDSNTDQNTNQGQNPN